MQDCDPDAVPGSVRLIFTPSTALASASEIFVQKSLEPLGADEPGAAVLADPCDVVVEPFAAVDATVVAAVVVVLSVAFVPELEPQADVNAATTSNVATVRFLAACPPDVFMPCMMSRRDGRCQGGTWRPGGVLTHMRDPPGDVPRFLR